MRKVVVIGGTSGIALAIAKAAKESGASVIVASSRAEKVEATKKGLGVDGRAVDLTDEQATAAFFEAVTASLVRRAAGDEGAGLTVSGERFCPAHFSGCCRQ